MPNDEQLVGLPSHTVWRLAKMPPSTLNYWVQIGLVRPHLRRTEGRRVEYWWTVQDAVVVRTVRSLRGVGASLQLVRKAKVQVESWQDSFTNVRLYWDGSDIQIARDQDGLLSTLRPGQGMFQLAGLPLDVWFAEAEAEAMPVDLAAFRKRNTGPTEGSPRG